jgi:hypothetical protein
MLGDHLGLFSPGNVAMLLPWGRLFQPQCKPDLVKELWPIRRQTDHAGGTKHEGTDLIQRDGTKLLTRLLKRFRMGLGTFALMLIAGSVSDPGGAAELAEVTLASEMASAEVVDKLHMIDEKFALSEPAYRGNDRGRRDRYSRFSILGWGCVQPLVFPAPESSFLSLLANWGAGEMMLSGGNALFRRGEVRHTIWRRSLSPQTRGQMADRL